MRMRIQEQEVPTWSLYKDAGRQEFEGHEPRDEVLSLNYLSSDKLQSQWKVQNYCISWPQSESRLLHKDI